MRPERLRCGDTIGIVAPASCSDPETVEQVLRCVEALGFKYKAGRSLYHYKGYLAGDDQVRADDINDMFGDEEVDAVFCLRGGYGSARLLDRLDYKLIKRNPKIFIGYSDITALHIAINQRTGLVTFHGPMLASNIIKGMDQFSIASMENALMVKNTSIKICNPPGYPVKAYKGGAAHGKLVGGNLSVLVSTLGSPYEIDTGGKLLFLEDVDEEPYRIDRMLNQLRLAGKLEAAAGIILCDWNGCDAKEPEKSLGLEEIFTDMAERLNKPVLSGYKIGHCSPVLTVPVGAAAEIDADKICFRITEKMVK